MEKLNELVELAKKATPGGWATDSRNAVVAVDDLANNGFVICAASGCDKLHNVAFIGAANPETILAIAEAFRDLEIENRQLKGFLEMLRADYKELDERAEAAEADNRKLLKTIYEEKGVALRIVDKLHAVEAKLAERDKQMNPDYFLNRIESSDKWGPEVELRIYESQLDASKSQDDHGGGIIELFTRPAADLAELVPPERNKWEGTDEEGYDIDYMEPSDIYQMGKDEGFNLCRAAILRKIEEAK